MVIFRFANFFTASEPGRSPMLRFSVALLAFQVFSGVCALAESTSEAEMVGAWRVTPSTYVVIPNMGNASGVMRIVQKDRTELIWHDGSFVTTLPESMPTNYTSLELILKQDGSFVARHVPSGFFFDSPTAQAEGTWALRNVPDPPHTNRMQQYFDLHFSSPSSNDWNTQVYLFQLGTSSSRQPVLHVFVGKHRQVSLTQHPEATLTNVAPSILFQNWYKSRESSQPTSASWTHSAALRVWHSPDSSLEQRAKAAELLIPKGMKGDEIKEIRRVLGEYGMWYRYLDTNPPSYDRWQIEYASGRGAVCLLFDPPTQSGVFTGATVRVSSP